MTFFSMTWNLVMDRKKTSHGQKEYGTTLNATVKTIISTRWTRARSIRKLVMDTRKDVYMQEHSTKTDTNAKPTLQAGKVDIHAAREGLAMVMDGLRVLQQAGVKMASARILSSRSGGKILLFPMIEIPGHDVGILVMDNGKTVFTTDGVSVMDKLPVMDDGHGKDTESEKS
jgi:hypothetical protein